MKDETGKRLNTKDFKLSSNKKRILFFTGREQIYRRSSKANVYLFDVISKKTTRLDEAKIMHASFSPDGSKIAFVRDNKANRFIIGLFTVAKLSAYCGDILFALPMQALG